MDTTVTIQDSPVTDESQKVTDVQNSPEMEQLQHLASLNKFIGKSSPTARTLGKKAQDFLTQQNTTPAATEQTPAASTTPAATTTPAAATSTSTDENAAPAADETEADEVEVEGGLKISLPNSKPKPAATTVYKTPEEAFQALQKNLGVTAADPTEFVEKATKAFNGHRAAAQEAGEIKKKYNDITSVFEQMPPDLLQSLDAWQKGEDYKVPFAQSSIDFNKPAEAQDTKALINKFFPGKFTEEDFANHTDTPNPAITIAEEASIDKFKTLKSQRESAALAQVETQKRYKAAFDASVTASVSRITEELPYYTDKARIPVIEADMQQLHTLRGTVLSKYFLNDDGTALPGAAARLAMLMDGKTITSALVDRESKKAKSKATEEVVTRGADTPSQTAGHNVHNGNQVPAEVKKVLDMLPKKKSVYS